MKTKSLSKKMKKLTIKYGNKVLFKGDAFRVEYNVDREVFTLRNMNSEITETVPANNFTVTVKAQCLGKLG